MLRSRERPSLHSRGSPDPEIPCLQDDLRTFGQPLADLLDRGDCPQGIRVDIPHYPDEPGIGHLYSISGIPAAFTLSMQSLAPWESWGLGTGQSSLMHSPMKAAQACGSIVVMTSLRICPAEFP